MQTIMIFNDNESNFDLMIKFNGDMENIKAKFPAHKKAEFLNYAKLMYFQILSEVLYTYTKIVLKKPWPEAEPIILADTFSPQTAAYCMKILLMSRDEFEDWKRHRENGGRII